MDYSSYMNQFKKSGSSYSPLSESVWNQFSDSQKSSYLQGINPSAGLSSSLSGYSTGDNPLATTGALSTASTDGLKLDGYVNNNYFTDSYFDMMEAQDMFNKAGNDEMSNLMGTQTAVMSGQVPNNNNNSWWDKQSLGDWAKIGGLALQLAALPQQNKLYKQQSELLKEQVATAKQARANSDTTRTALATGNKYTA